MEEKHGRFKIIVTELPYQVNKARLIESIADMVKDKRIEGISNIDDHSDRNGMHIEIDLKRDASPQIVLNQLYSYTQMQTTFGVIMLAIVNGEPKTLTLKEMLQEYIKFQEEVITRRTIYDLKKARERAHILEGLKIALDNIDEIISIIRNSKDRPTAKARMTERFGLDDVQTEAIVQMRLGQLTGLERQKIEDELAALELKIKDYEDILAHEERLKCYEIPEGSRTSKGMNIANLLPITAEEKVTSMIRVPEFDEEKYLVMVTRNGIIKRTLLSAYNSARKGGLIAIELDEGDELAWVRVTDGSNELIVATKKGMAIRFHERDVRLVGRTARGVKAITLGEDDCVVGMARLREGGKVLTVSETGYGRLSPISDYRIQYRGGKGLLNYHVDKYGDVAAIKVVDLDDDVILISADGVIIRIQADSIRECARPSKGVRVMRIGEDNKVVTLARAPHEEEDDGEELEGLENTEGGEEEIPDSAGDEEAQTPEE